MASLKFALGMVPKTAKIEAEEEALRNEYQELVKFSGSKELKDFEELEKWVTSKEFKTKRKEIETSRFKDTEEFRREQEYKRLKKSKRINGYYKTRVSSSLSRFHKLEGSDKLTSFEELGEYVKSSAFEAHKQDKSVKFKKTEAYRKLKEYQKLKKSGDIKFYYKFKASTNYQNFLQLDGSDEIKRYENLEKEVNSKEFADYKAGMNDKKKFEKTEEFRQLKEYERLKKSEKIIWYYKTKDSNKFDEINRWEMTFSDDFEGSELDKDKWLTSFYYGDKFLKGGYSIATELHAITEGDNVEVRGSVCKIHTRRESVKSRVWDPQRGFYLKNFAFSSGVINTGKHFRQKYGVFKAKVRLNHAADVRQSFWMLADQIIPHVDVFKTEKNNLWMNTFWGNPTHPKEMKKKTKKLGAGRFTKDFYIYTLEWTPNKMVWKINDKIVNVQTNGIPQEPMYILFSGGVHKENARVPVAMEIDWVKVYKEAKN